MLIRPDTFGAIKAGTIDRQFRRWTKPTVKTGGTLKTKIGLLKIGRIDDLSPEDVTEAEARRAGFRDLPDFHKWLATMKPGHLFQRIEVGYLGPGEEK